MQTVSPLICVDLDKELTSVHSCIVSGSFNHAGFLLVGLMLLIHTAVLQISVVVLLETSVEFHDFA